MTDIPYLKYEMDIAPSSAVLKKEISRSITQSWKDQIVWKQKESYYPIANENLQKPNIQGLSRIMQCQIAWLRTNSMSRCSHGCQNKCSICNVGFSTEHYLLDCLKTEGDRHMLIDPETANSLDRINQISYILASEDAIKYRNITKILNENPPEICCDMSHNHKRWTPW